VPAAPAAPVHPNALGMREIGGMVVDVLGDEPSRAAA
jgi:lysophospholipase L1-like esterase